MGKKQTWKLLLDNVRGEASKKKKKEKRKKKEIRGSAKYSI